MTSMSPTRSRYIPTYVHEPIFMDSKLAASCVRVTPTFTSSVMDVSGYGVDGSRQRGSSFNRYVPKNRSVVSKSIVAQPRNLWYDGHKQGLLDDLSRQGGLARDRKILELASDIVFGCGSVYLDRHQVPDKNGCSQLATTTSANLGTTVSEGHENKEGNIQNQENQDKRIIAEPTVQSQHPKPSKEESEKVQAPLKKLEENVKKVNKVRPQTAKPSKNYQNTTERAQSKPKRIEKQSCCKNCCCSCPKKPGQFSIPAPKWTLGGPKPTYVVIRKPFAGGRY